MHDPCNGGRTLGHAGAIISAILIMNSTKWRVVFIQRQDNKGKDNEN